MDVKIKLGEHEVVALNTKGILRTNRICEKDDR